MTFRIRNKLTFCSPNDVGRSNPRIPLKIAPLHQIDTLYLQLFPLSIHYLSKHERNDKLWEKYIQTILKYIQIQHSNHFRIHISKKIKKNIILLAI